MASLSAFNKLTGGLQGGLQGGLKSIGIAGQDAQVAAARADDEEEELDEVDAERARKKQKAEEKKRKAKLRLERRKLSKATFDSGNWPLPDKYKNKQTITLQEVVHLGIPRGELVRYLTQELRESESCRSLPFAILLLAVYGNSALAHENAQQAGNMMHSIEEHIIQNARFGFNGPYYASKNLDNVDSYTDFWSWLSVGFIPLIFIESQAVSQGSYLPSKPYVGANESSRGMLLNYNRIIGGVRLRFAEGILPEDGCKTKYSLLPAYGLQCVGGLGYEMDPEKWEAWQFPVAKLTEWFFTHDDQTTIQSRIEALEYGDKLSNSTTRIELSIPSYNAEFGLYSLTKINFFFARTGRIWKDVSSACVFSDWWPKATYVAVDITFATCILYIVFKELLEMRQSFVANGLKRFLRTYINPWNAVDWFAVIAGIVVVVLIRMNFDWTQELNKKAIEVGKLLPAASADQSVYQDKVMKTMDALEKELYFSKMFRYVMTVYPLVVILRFFKAFSAQPRLAMISATLVHASTDLIHYMIVYMAVFSSFVISGVAFFGRGSDEFVSVARSMNTLFRSLVGNLDWDSLEKAGSYEAFFFFAFFQLLMTQVLWNLLVSILIHSYGKVKISARGAEMVWQEFYQELETRFGNSQIIPYWKVLNALKYDEKVDTVKKITIKPKNPRTTYLEVHNTGGKTIMNCFQQYPNMEKLCTETELVSGIVVFCDGHGEVIEVRVGDTVDFPIKLDEHHRFSFYFDSTGGTSDGSGGDDVLELLPAVREAESGNSAMGMVDVAYLRRSIEGMLEEQATDIITKAVEEFYEANHEEPGFDDLRTLILHFDHRTSKCLRAVQGEPKRKFGDKVVEVVDYNERQTVGACLANVFHIAEEQTALSEKLIRQMVPDRDHVESSDTETKRIQPASFEELNVGDNVKILNDMRAIINSCFDAGLAVENSEIRKLCAGLHGKVVDKDPSDETICLEIAGIHGRAAAVTRLWFAPEAIESPKGQKPWGPPTEAELQRLEDEEAQQRRYAAALKEQKVLAAEKTAELEARKAALERELVEDIMPTATKASEAAEELWHRIEKQRNAKLRAEQGAEVLQERLNKLLHENKHFSQKARADQEVLHVAAVNRNEYFDTMRELVTENQNIRTKLEEEQEKLSAQHARNAVETKQATQYEASVQATIKKLEAERAIARKQESDELAWIIGQAETLVIQLGGDWNNVPDAIPYLHKLRNVAIEAWKNLQDI